MNEKLREVEVGQHVIFVDEDRGRHHALVVAVWGETVVHDRGISYPTLNLVYVSSDESKTDQYGRQIERVSSITPIEGSMAPGFCWLFEEDLEEALVELASREANIKH